MVRQPRQLDGEAAGEGGTMNPKETHSPLLANIPAELRTPKLWLQSYLRKNAKHPDKKPRKCPVMTWATPADREKNCQTLDYILENRIPTDSGVQRFIEKSEGFVFIDLDHVRNVDTGEVEPWASELVEKLDTYCEISASGTGFHLVCRGTLSEDFKVKGNPVEIYAGNTGKVLHMTGNVYDLRTSIEDCQEQVTQLLKEQQEKSGRTPHVEVLNVMTEHDVKKTADTDLPEACLDGWLGQVCKERMSAFPRAYAWLALLAAASVLVPRETKLRCNLYVDLDGGVHTGKSSAFEWAFHLLSLGKPALMKMKAGSAEGLVERVGDVGGAARLLYPDELAHLLEKSMIERSSFSRFLTSAFYDDVQELTVTKRKALTFNCRLSLAGGTVADQFGDLFGSATTGGLYDRFLFGKCPTGYQYLWQPLDDVHPVYVPPGTMEGGIFVDADRPVPVSIHPAVFEVRNWWMKELRIGARVAELCLRAATICASFDGRRTLTADMLEPALALAHYQMRVRAFLQPNPGENPDARMAFMVRNWLTANAPEGKWIGRRDLFRAVNAYRLGGKVFDGAVRAMKFNGELEEDKVGRMVVVRLVQEPSVINNSMPSDASSTAVPSPTVITPLSEEVSHP
jgi:hypothetical protein